MEKKEVFFTHTLLYKSAHCIILFLFVFLWVGGIVFAIHDHRVNMRMIADNLRTQGIVLNKEYLGPSDEPDPMHISVRYNVGAIAYERTLLVGNETYDLATIGQPLELYYAANDPTHIFIASTHAKEELIEEFIARMLVGTALGAPLLFFFFTSCTHLRKHYPINIS